MLCKFDNNNVLVSGIIPRSDKISAKAIEVNRNLKNKCRKRNIYLISRGGSRAAATSKIECFVIIVNGYQPLTIITKRSILDAAAALDPPLISNSNINPKYDCNKSGLHLNWKGTNKLVENFLFALSKFDNSHKAQVSNINFYKNKLGSSESQKCIRRIDSSAEAFKNLRNMKRKKPKHVFLGHLNITSIKNKFDPVWELIKDTFDVFLLSESKLDSSFPDDQFSIPGYRK